MKYYPAFAPLALLAVWSTSCSAIPHPASPSDHQALPFSPNTITQADCGLIVVAANHPPNGSATPMPPVSTGAYNIGEMSSNDPKCQGVHLARKLLRALATGSTPSPEVSKDLPVYRPASTSADIIAYLRPENGVVSLVLGAPNTVGTYYYLPENIDMMPTDHGKWMYQVIKKCVPPPST